MVELMISVSIMLILFSMLIVIFKATQESFEKAGALQDVINTSRMIIERMHDEVSAAFFDQQGRASLVGLDETTGKIKPASAGDELFFCIPLTELQDSDFDPATAEADDELGLIVKELQFTFFDGNAYVTTWDSRPGAAQEGKAPKTVKVAFRVSDSDNMIVKDFETIVFISSGKRY
jgi:hypothetical protein